MTQKKSQEERNRLERIATYGDDKAAAEAMVELKKINNTYHWCPEFDYLVVCNEHPEWEFCEYGRTALERAKEYRALYFLSLLRETFGGYPDMSGGCLKVAMLLQVYMQEGQTYYDGDHVVTRIDQQLYDINGIVPGVGFVDKNCKFIAEANYGEDHLALSFYNTFENKRLINFGDPENDPGLLF